MRNQYSVNTESDNSTDEFEFDVNKLKTAKKNGLCRKCDKKFSSQYKFGVCKVCLRDFTIIKTQAKNIYNLDDDDLENLDNYSFKNAYGGYMFLYFLKEVRLKAIEKRFDIVNPTIDSYANSIKILLNEAEQRAEARRIRSKKIEATKKEKQDLRHENLKHALKEKGIAIRGDSFWCQQYLSGNERDLAKVVDIMVAMDFFCNKTKYNEIMRDKIMKLKRHNENRDPYDEYYRLEESDKNYAKKKALKLYLTEHDMKSVPQVVLDEFID